MPFQFNAKNIFLTYPKSDFPLSGYLAFCWTLPNIIYACVSSEKHEDGSLHRHAFLQFGKPFRTRNEKVFDYQGFHPNIQAARSPSHTLNYVKKEADFLERGAYVEPSTKTKETIPAATIIENAKEMTYVEFMAWASQERVMYADKIWNAAAKKDLSTILDNSSYNSSFLDPAFLAMMEAKLDEGIVREKALVFVGASGIGKTVLAKKMVDKPALFVSHIDQLKQFRPGYHKGIVFDDISFKHTPVTNQISVVDFDNPRAIHCRHTVANIPAGIMKIFTCNEAPLELEHEAIARRVTVIHCNHGHLNKYRNPLAKKIN